MKDKTRNDQGPSTWMHRVAIMAAAGLFALSIGCDNDSWNSEKIQPPPPGSRVRIQVEAVTVHRGDVYAPILATGTLCPFMESKISAKVSGRIERIFVDEGDKVEEGQVLAHLEQRDFELARKSALAQRDMIRATAKEAELNLKNMTREKERMESLYKSKVVSEKAYDDAATAFSMAQARSDGLEAQFKAAEADLELAERRLQDSRIRAPFPGFIAERFANEGEIVSTGTPFFLVMNIDTVKAEVRIPEIELTRVFLGIPVDVELDALPGRRFEGTVSAINPSIDPVNRNFTIKIDIPNKGQVIKSGMFARITVKTDISRNVPIVPEKALVTDSAGKDAVFVLEGATAILKPVTTGASGKGVVEIRQGIAEGEKVLVTGNYGLADRSEVEARVVGY